MIFTQIGLEPERIKMYNMSSTMAVNFVEASIEMTEKIIELGPNPFRENTNHHKGA